MWAHGRSGTQFSFPHVTHDVLDEALNPEKYAAKRKELREQAERAAAKAAASGRAERLKGSDAEAQAARAAMMDDADGGDYVEGDLQDGGPEHAGAKAAKPTRHLGAARCALDATDRAYAMAKYASADDTFTDVQSANASVAAGVGRKVQFEYCNGRKEGSQGTDFGSPAGLRECARRAAEGGKYFVTHIKPMHTHGLDAAVYHRTPREVMLSAKAAGVRVVLTQTRQNTLHRELSSCEMASGCFRRKKTIKLNNGKMVECPKVVADAATAAGVPSDDTDFCNKGLLQLGEVKSIGKPGRGQRDIKTWQWHDPSHEALASTDKNIYVTLSKLAGLERSLQSEDEMFEEGLEAAMSLGLRVVPIDFAQVIAGEIGHVPEPLTLRVARAFALEGLLAPDALDRMVELHSDVRAHSVCSSSCRPRRPACKSAQPSTLPTHADTPHLAVPRAQTHCGVPYHESEFFMDSAEWQGNLSAIEEEHGAFTRVLIEEQLGDSAYRWMVDGHHVTWPTNVVNPAHAPPAADLITCAAVTDDPMLEMPCTKASLRNAALVRAQNFHGEKIIAGKTDALRRFIQE